MPCIEYGNGLHPVLKREYGKALCDQYETIAASAYGVMPYPRPKTHAELVSDWEARAEEKARRNGVEPEVAPPASPGEHALSADGTRNVLAAFARPGP